MALLVTRCCFGCASLREGTQVIGWLSLVGSAVAFGLMVYLLTQMSSGATKLLIEYSCLAVFAFAQFIFSLLVIRSAQVNGKPKLLLPWIITQVIGIPLSIINFIVSMAMSGGEGLSLTKIIQLIVSTVVGTYYTIVVYSFYRQVLSRTHERSQLTDNLDKTEEIQT